ncbi:MAG: hypothetical protein WD058_00605, partial [Dehalococcoidia bacterium]
MNRLIKRGLTALGATMLMLLLGASAASAAGTATSHQHEADAQVTDRVTICHRTSSATNPYVRITISVNGLNGHGGHAGDIILNSPDEECPTLTLDTSVTADVGGDVDIDVDDDVDVGVTVTTNAGVTGNPATANVNLLSDLHIFLNGMEITDRVLSGEINLNIWEINRLLEDQIAATGVDVGGDVDLNLFLWGDIEDDLLTLRIPPTITFLVEGVDLTSAFGVTEGVNFIIGNSPAMTSSSSVTGTTPAAPSAPSIPAASAPAASPDVTMQPATGLQAPAPAAAGNGGLVAGSATDWAIASVA